MMMMMIIIIEELCRSRRLLSRITASEMRFRLSRFTSFLWTMYVKKISGIKNTRIRVDRAYNTESERLKCLKYNYFFC